MSTRYQDGAARSHGFGTLDRTCIEAIRTRLKDLTGLELQIQHAYEVSDGAARSDGFGTPDRTCLEGIRTGLQYLTAKEHQFQHAY